jgi:hypothetical protein
VAVLLDPLGQGAVGRADFLVRAGVGGRGDQAAGNHDGPDPTGRLDRLGHGHCHLHVYLRLFRVGAVVDGERGAGVPDALLGDQAADLR